MWYLLKSEVNVNFVLPGQVCTDINECETGAARNCVPNSICINTRVNITARPRVGLSLPRAPAPLLAAAVQLLGKVTAKVCPDSCYS